MEDAEVYAPIEITARELKVGDIYSRDGELWYVEFVLPGAIDYSVYARVVNESGRWIFPYIPLDEQMIVVRTEV